MPNSTMRVAQPSGTVYWIDSLGLYHNNSGPAVVYSNGSKEWYIQGTLHRMDGPAIERVHGPDEWLLNGKRHRLGGPAVESKCYKWCPDQYWVHGRNFTEDEYYRFVDQLTGEMFTPPGKKLAYGQINSSDSNPYRH
jgi:hypothetical protein